MTAAERWKTLPKGLYHTFSPSGHALAFRTAMRPRTHTLEIQFLDDRPPVTLNEPNIYMLAWASDTELVYSAFKSPLNASTQAYLRVFSLEEKQSRLLVEVDLRFTMTGMKRPGHLSVLAEWDGRRGLFDLDAQTGTCERVSAFDAAFEALDISIVGGHVWSADRRQVVVVAWPYDYLEEGIVADETNSQWIPVLDNPSIAETQSVFPDGRTLTNREYAAEAKTRKPRCLFLLSDTGGYVEIPGTNHARSPLLSPDGSLLIYTRRDRSLWVMRMEDFTQRRIGRCSPIPKVVIHPDGTLLCGLENETAPMSLKPMRGGRWCALRLQGGEVRPVT